MADMYASVDFGAKIDQMLGRDSDDSDFDSDAE